MTVAAEADNCGGPECALLAGDDANRRQYHKPPPAPVYLYASLRLKGNSSGARLGSLPGLVEASEGRSIEFRAVPYDHFVVLPHGIQIPLTHVSQAIPVNAQASIKVSRAARIKDRQDRIDAKLAAMKPKATSEEIVDEDDTDYGEEVTEGDADGDADGEV